MATLIDPAMPTWAPDTRHYVTSGRHLAVHVAAEFNDATAALIGESLEANGMPSLQSGVHQIVVEPTTVFECNADGSPISLTPLRTFPPGTTHEQAIAEFEE
jgi:hypothetical protein